MTEEDFLFKAFYINKLGRGYCYFIKENEQSLISENNYKKYCKEHNFQIFKNLSHMFSDGFARVAYSDGTCCRIDPLTCLTIKPRFVPCESGFMCKFENGKNVFYNSYGLKIVDQLNINKFKDIFTYLREDYRYIEQMRAEFFVGKKLKFLCSFFKDYFSKSKENKEVVKEQVEWVKNVMQEKHAQYYKLKNSIEKTEKMEL